MAENAGAESGKSWAKAYLSVVGFNLLFTFIIAVIIFSAPKNSLIQSFFWFIPLQVVGDFVAGIVLLSTKKYSYATAFLVSAGLVMISGVIIFFGLCVAALSY